MAKARIIYRPEGGSKREWDIDLENPAWDVAYNTEKVTGWPWMEFSQRLAQSSYIALQALIFTLRKRDEPRLEISSVTPTLAEFDVEVEEDDEPVRESGEA